MAKAEIQKKNNEVVEKKDSGLTLDWKKLQLQYFLSDLKSARQFLKQEAGFTQKQLENGNVIKIIENWKIEKKEWEQDALNRTIQNLSESRTIELKDYITEEGAVVKQLLNMAKIAMNNLVKKGKLKGKDVLELKNTKGFKQVTDATIAIMKYSRERLGIPFEKEEERLKNSVNFNFDLINLDGFDADKVINFYKKKRNAGQINTTKVNGRDIDGISNTIESEGEIQE